MNRALCQLQQRPSPEHRPRSNASGFQSKYRNDKNLTDMTLIMQQSATQTIKQVTALILLRERGKRASFRGESLAAPCPVILNDTVLIFMSLIISEPFLSICRHLHFFRDLPLSVFCSCFYWGSPITLNVRKEL